MKLQRLVVFWSNYVVQHAFSVSASLFLGFVILSTAAPVVTPVVIHHLHHASKPAVQNTAKVSARPAAVKKPAPATAPAQPAVTAPAPVAAPAPAPVTTVTPVTPKPGSGAKALVPAPAAAPAAGGGTSTAPSGSGTSSSGGSSAPPPATGGYTSTNWSGYVAMGSTYTSVSGSWIAPSPTGNGTGTTADSTWIGIGGASTTDLIQVGTENNVSASGRVSTDAFYELLPDVATPIPSLNVSAGDSLSANIQQTSAGNWTITITDNTNGQSFSINVAYNSSLNSAEWIEEDPSFASGGLVPFDNFGVSTFSSGSAVAGGASQTLAALNAAPITLVTNGGQPRAVPSILSGNGFIVTRNASN